MSRLSIILIIVLIIAIVGLAATARYNSDMHAIREHIDSLASQVAETKCGETEYALRGNGYPVLAVHGDAGGFDQGLLMANWTIDPEFQVVSVSRFGYLRTPMPANASVAMQADAFACLLDSLGINQAAVVAYSAGSSSAVQFAMRHPERVSALILVSPVGLGKGPILQKPVYDIFFKNDFAYWATITYFGPIVDKSWAGLPKGFTPTPEEKAEIRTLLVGLLPVSARSDGSYFDIYTGTPEMLNSSENKGYPYSSIKAPTLVISSVDDPLALHENAIALADRIPGAQMMSVLGGGHALLGHYGEVRSEITQFISSNTAQPESSQR